MLDGSSGRAAESRGDALPQNNSCVWRHRLPPLGLDVDFGAPPARLRGSGDPRANNRRRETFAETECDTFLVTRNADRGVCALDNGRYHVTDCVGDAEHEQIGHRIAVAGALLIDHVATPSGEFCECIAEGTVNDGRLTIDLGQQGRMQNTCINGVRIA